MFATRLRQPKHPARVSFQAHVAEMREAIGHLEQVEQAMAGALSGMKAEGDTRERILVAEAMLSDLRHLLNRDRAPGADTTPGPSLTLVT
jgi:hypothetical protein